MKENNRSSASKIFLFWLTAIFTLCLQPSGTVYGAEMDRAGYTTSDVCAYCHSEIHEAWTRSAHSRSYSDPTFTDAYRHAYVDTKGAAKDHCFKCHSPTMAVTGDIDAALPITKEGVTCDFCHTVESVNLDNLAAPFKLDVGGEKRASMKLDKNKKFEKTDAAHQAAYTKWFNKSELCGGCHEVMNMKGIVISGTYSEWKSSAYAKGASPTKAIQCQDCHMSQIKGKPIDSSVKKAGVNTISDHSLSHNLARLSGSVSLDIVKTGRAEDGRFIVEVALANVKAGHNMPTGLPSHSLTLEVEARPAGAAALIHRATLGKKIADESGEILTSDVDAYIKGAKIAEDTSLAPNEKRIVKFDLGRLPQGEIGVVVRAYLSNATHNTHIPLATTEKK